jgi:hypothetical protein
MGLLAQGIFALILIAIITALALLVDKRSDYEDHE